VAGNKKLKFIELFLSFVIIYLVFCKHSRSIIFSDIGALDINWDKTELMFFTQEREIDFPKTIMIQNKTLNVIDKFKLLNIIIDNDLTFLPQVARIKINQRLFSIKKIFFLENSVKLLFFKTFILP
jgi:hypothetical protein